MKKVLLTVFSVCTIHFTAYSQVTIGSDLPPAQGALLDLKNSPSFSTKGLGLPRVALKAIEGDLAETMGKETNTLDHDQHVGLVVYNITKNEESIEKRFCPGVHVWNGKKWTPLVPYPDITHVGRKLIKVENRGFTYLDPNNPADRWPAGKSNTDYPLGYIGTFTDNRKNDTQQTYNYTRFYVGYKTMDATYEISHNYSCDPNTEVLHTYTETVVEETFDDGVWMTQNLRAIKTNDGADIAYRVNANYPDTYNNEGHYYIPGHAYNQSRPTTIDNNYGILYNWAAAIGVGTSTGPEVMPRHNTINNQGGSKNKDVTYQGICPNGWYLPSDQEWTDLANGIQLNVNSTANTIFADKLDGSVTAISYDDFISDNSSTSGFGGYIGQAMKSKTAVNVDPKGKSKTSNTGGFDVYMTGSSSSNEGAGVGTYNYGTSAYFWTSSLYGPEANNNRSYAYYTWFTGGLSTAANQNIFKGRHNFMQTFSVRCKRIIE